MADNTPVPYKKNGVFFIADYEGQRVLCRSA